MLQAHASSSGRHPGSLVVSTIDLSSEGVMTSAVRIPCDTEAEDIFITFDNLVYFFLIS